MSNRTFFIPSLLFLAFSVAVHSCRFSEIGGFDYPPRDRSKLKGPKAETLEIKPIHLSETASYPFYGSTIQSNQHLLLVGHNEDGGRLGILRASAVQELPKSDINSLFATPSGTIWGLQLTNENFALRRFTNGTWTEEGAVSGRYHYKTVRVTDQELWFMTSKGLVIWDINQKKIRQEFAVDRDRLFTENFSVERDGKELFIYRNQNLQTPVARFRLSDYVDGRSGISNDIWGAFEDKNQQVWLVVKDARWDGILLKFDGKKLEKLSTIPVGNYDSGRGISQFNLDKAGTLWLRIDGIHYLFTADGRWLSPQFDLLENTFYAGDIFTDPNGNLIMASSRKLFSILL